ncbi:MAG: hypothetical protein E6R11_00885 [Rhodocyclaceae bacterium]|nr:MAG: hypothetical protein EYC71_01300 [Gammaproteobacteria bacterium]TXG80604.1 MAG: hypothetical protein E6R11_00885 [Rhodocyclaceae bacterium]
MNEFRILPVALAVLTMAAVPEPAKACGEVMYRMGGALRYQAFVTRNPAEVLVYSSHDSARPEAERQRFHDNLEKAGHRVTMINNETELTKALGEHSFDVIITLAADVDAVSRELAAASRQSILIPVIDRDASDERAMRERFPQLVRTDSSLNQFLKSIEKSMKASGT